MSEPKTEKEFIEADITVGHHGLSLAESMTVRVALNNLCVDMVTRGLGNDEHGKAMAKAYLKNATSVIEKIHASIESKEGATHEPPNG